MADEQQFGCTIDELKELMQHRGPDGYKMLQHMYGGSLEICNRLVTSPTEGKTISNSSGRRAYRPNYMISLLILRGEIA